MALHHRLYQLFHHRPPGAHQSADALVSALWQRLFPRRHFGQNHRLDQLFARMSRQPELAALQLCPYYFDQVTYVLPTRDQVQHMESCNLRLHWFNSWTDEKQEQQRASKQHRREQIRANDGPRPRPWSRPQTGTYLSRLCQLQESDTGRSLSTERYIYLIYGYSQ